MEDQRSIALIQDPGADLIDRIRALEVLLEGDARIVPSLIEQLETELDRDDTRFVIYLFGAIGQVYDRRWVSPLAKLLRRSEVELTFRMQCVKVLQEFYQQSLVGLDVVTKALKAEQLEDPAVLRFLAAPERAGQVFSVKGAPLNDQDRDEIEKVLQAIAEDSEEVQPLQEEAQAALEMISNLKNPPKALLTSLLGIQPK